MSGENTAGICVGLKGITMQITYGSPKIWGFRIYIQQKEG